MCSHRPLPLHTPASSASSASASASLPSDPAGGCARHSTSPTPSRRRPTASSDSGWSVGGGATGADGGWGRSRHVTSPAASVPSVPHRTPLEAGSKAGWGGGACAARSPAPSALAARDRKPTRVPSTPSRGHSMKLTMGFPIAAAAIAAATIAAATVDDTDKVARRHQPPTSATTRGVARDGIGREAGSASALGGSACRAGSAPGRIGVPGGLTSASGAHPRRQPAEARGDAELHRQRREVCHDPSLVSACTRPAVERA